MFCTAGTSQVGTVSFLLLGMALGLSLPMRFAVAESALQNIENIAQQEAEERKRKYEQARDQARQTNQQQLQPNMMQHLGKAAEHKKEAEQAREQKNFGKAEDEERKAMMEQMKAQQVSQQMKENEKSAQQNNQGAQKLTNPTADNAPKLKAAENAVISLRDPEYSSNTSQAAAPIPEEKLPIPKEELANLGAALSAAQASLLPKPVEKAVVSSETIAAGTGVTSKGYGYDESLGKNSSFGGGSATSAVTPSTASVAPASGSGFSGGVVGGGGGGGGSGKEEGGFWASAGKQIDAENSRIEATAEKLSLKNLRGGGSAKLAGLPGKDLSDEAFWKKVGKEPLKCRATTEIGKSQRAKCLRTARRDFERNWRRSRPASDPTPAKSSKVADGRADAKATP